jgi:DNA-binding response OmpR family regulator
MPYIVVIESDSDVAGVLTEFLRTEGYRCDVAYSKLVAHRLLNHVRPDLVLVECWLADGDGLQLARLASKMGVPAVVMSSSLDRGAEAQQAGLPCLQKPFRLAALSIAITNLLRREALVLLGPQALLPPQIGEEG